jgi:hypothetical protein
MALSLRESNQQTRFSLEGMHIDDVYIPPRVSTYAKIALLSAGVFCVVAYLTQFTLAILPALAVGLLCCGVRLRSLMPLFPGSLLGGAGLGLLCINSPLYLVRGDIAGSIFLFCFALGWFSIFFLSRLYTRDPQWWPLLPGSMMALTSLCLII